MNKLEYAGRVTRDAEVFTTKTGHDIVSFSVADTVITGKDKQEGLFMDFKAFSPWAGLAATLKKGDPIYIIASGRPESWEKEGKTFRKVVWVPMFMSRGGPSGSGGGPVEAPAEKPATKVEDEDDVPF